LGYSTEATGAYSTALGFETQAIGAYSTAIGNYAAAYANNTTAIGQGILADDENSIVIGMFNDYNTSTTALFQVGNGTSTVLSNAFTILQNGTITAPSFDLAEITDAKALITKEYLEANSINASGLEAIDEGNGIGWRLIGRDPANYGNIGLDAIDLSYSPNNSDTFGATGQWSTAMGYLTTVSGNGSTAMGLGTKAIGLVSTAMGSNTTASGDYSTSTGYLTIASGENSIAMGDSSQSSGNTSTAIGNFAYSIGTSSIAIGTGVKSESQYSIAIGKSNVGGGNPDTWTETDPLFEIGNGVITPSNALTVLKNGTITAPSFDLAEITDAKALITKE
jgi:hypothetical protein